MRLPRSTVARAPAASPVRLSITTEQIVVSGQNRHQRVAAIKGGKIASPAKGQGEYDYLIKPLLGRLAEMVAADPAAGASAGPVIWADQATPYRALSEVLYTVGQARFEGYQLAVRNGGKVMAIRVPFKKYRAATDRRVDRDHPRLNLTVVVSGRGFVVRGRAGAVPGPHGQGPTVACRAALVDGRCPFSLAPGSGAGGGQDGYDHQRLRALVQTIKKKYADERCVVVAADHKIPYQLVVRTLDTLRGGSTARCTGADGCLFDQPTLAAGVQ